MFTLRMQCMPMTYVPWRNKDIGLRWHTRVLFWICWKYSTKNVDASTCWREISYVGIQTTFVCWPIFPYGGDNLRFYSRTRHRVPIFLVLSVIFTHPPKKKKKKKSIYLYLTHKFCSKNFNGWTFRTLNWLTFWSSGLTAELSSVDLL